MRVWKTLGNACESVQVQSLLLKHHGEGVENPARSSVQTVQHLHAEQEEYERNKHTMSKNELRQLALDLRKQNPEFQALHSQVAQQVAERFYEARQRFLDGLANKPKKKKPHRYLSLVYPQSGWKLSNWREVGQGKNKKKKARLYLSKIGFFTLIVHRVFPLERVSKCVLNSTLQVEST